MLRIVVAAAALLLFLAAAAPASIWPAPTLGSVRPAAKSLVVVVRRGRDATRSRACMKTSQLARWISPVACEQPPRSETLVVPLLGG